MTDRSDFDRRRFLASLGLLGAASATLPDLLAAEAEGAAIDAGTLAAAERLAGLEFTPEERELMLEGVREQVDLYRRLREVEVDNAVAPALVFHPEPPGAAPPGMGAPVVEGGGEAAAGAEAAGGVGGARERAAARRAAVGVSAGAGAAPETGGDPGAGSVAPGTGSAPAAVPVYGAEPEPEVERPEDDAELAYLSVAELGGLLRRGEVTSVELTRLYLDRLDRFDPLLHCVVTFTRVRALEAAERADAELAAGRDRGPLHGIPWGAKDLLAVPGYRTTWGAMPYREQLRPELATAVARLDEAGAVLVAKLTLGALAWGDVWFGGRTRSPWDPEEGSSGSSAGSAAATAGGLVGFSLGSETWGSIVSPSTRCGATGLRPTFGRVSRHGAMALSWSMDKLGPICRSVEDCARVFAAVRGPDGLDLSVVERPFTWPPRRDPASLRVGYVASLFEGEPPEELPEEARERVAEQRAFDLATLETLEALGFELVPIELPENLPVDALSFVLSVEAAAAFDELTRSDRDEELVRQIEQAWPNVFRQARLVPAVEYVQANRVRTILAERMRDLMRRVDVYVAPSFGGDNLLLTNLTGHPSVVLPNGFRANGMPGSITFMGDLWGEEALLAVARLYQEATDFHRRHPDLAAAEREMEREEREEGAAASEPEDLAALEAGYRAARWA